jgi:hypothetical protein
MTRKIQRPSHAAQGAVKVIDVAHQTYVEYFPTDRAEAMACL